MGERRLHLDLDEVNTSEAFAALHGRMLNELDNFPKLTPIRLNEPDARKAELFGRPVRISPHQVDVISKQMINKFTITISELDLDDIHSLSRVDDLEEIGTIIQGGKKGPWQLRITLVKDANDNLVTVCGCRNPNGISLPLDFVFREVDELEYVWNNLTSPKSSVLIAQAKPMKGDPRVTENKDFQNGGAWSGTIVEPKRRMRKG